MTNQNGSDAIQSASNEVESDAPPTGVPNPIGSGQAEVSTEFSWRVHEELRSASVRIDNKAWILSGLTGANALLVYNLSGAGKPFEGLQGASLLLYRAAIVDLAIAITLALLVVFPLLSRRGVAKDVNREKPEPNYLYFGYMRGKRVKLQDVVEGLTPLPREQVKLIARVAVVVSRQLWWKYRLMQAALLVWLASIVLLLLAWLS